VWHTYAPDGRSLMIRRTGDGWVATCGPNRVEAPTPADAIRGALGADADDSLEAWIAEHAAALDSTSG
jgi:hypothetical protein